jgi:7-cyano-7-deazaguanine synthase in queuosine biosynthesis
MGTKMTAILWSGGADSTLLLHDIATKAKQNQDTINAITITHPQVLNSHILEHQQKTLKQLSKMGLNNITHNLIKIDTPLIAYQTGIVQAAIWIGIIPPYLGSTENLYTGHIKEDDIWHYRQWVYGAFDNLQTLLSHTGTLQIPFEWTPKHEITKRLQQLELHTWTCENHIHKPCQKCTPCKKQKISHYINTHIEKPPKKTEPTLMGSLQADIT